MKVKDRLLTYIKSKNLSNRAFELKCGLSNGYVKGLDDSIRPKTLGLITEQFAELNTSWLLTGEGEMLKEKVSNQPTSTAAGDGIFMSREVFDLIVSQQSTLKDQQITISSQNTTNQKNLETIQESIKAVLELMTRLIFQQTQIQISAPKDENAECADAM